LNTGWWLTYPSEKYDFVNWDDDIPNMMGKIIQMFQTTNQNIMWIWLFLLISLGKKPGKIKSLAV
jgi:hypothetical protein